MPREQKEMPIDPNTRQRASVRSFSRRPARDPNTEPAPHDALISP